MGVIPVNENDKGFNFDGESSKTFDLIITGGAIFDAPERDVELIEIPGRNGSYVQDLGRFKNVTVTYQCALTSTKEHEFVDAMRKVREWLCSKRGYCRLWDDFNPGEYRMAMFKGYIEVTNEAPVVGRFELSFDCMPQRFLLNGDNPVEVSDGGSIFNPTMFGSSPLLQVWGYGDININDNKITIPNSQLGAVTIGAADEAQPPVTLTVSGSQLENGDTINISRLGFTTIVGSPSGKSFDGDASFTTNPYFTPQEELSAGGYWNVYFEFEQQTFVKGTASNKTTSFTATYGLTDGTDNTVDYAVTYSYDGDSEFTFSVTITPQSSQYTYAMCTWPEIIGNSTQSSLGAPLYIDLEIGEAYKIENDVLISVNNSVSIPAKLPKLKPGANAITYDNTVTSFVITPRWWEV